jgi:hypothetical protein
MALTKSGDKMDDKKPTLPHVLDEFRECADIVHRTLPDLAIDMIFFEHLLGSDQFTRDVAVPFMDAKIEDVRRLLQRSQYVEILQNKPLIKAILEGSVAIFFDDRCYVVDVSKAEERSLQQSETEAIITGPHDSFNEVADTNLALIRRRVKSSHLKSIMLEVGEVTKTKVYILYIADLANMEYVKELQQRIESIEIDAVLDGNMLVQYIDDFPNSIFPLIPTTERVDAAVSRLVAGRILVVVDGSPSVISAPASFFEFFSSPDDYYQRWMLGTATRLLRFVAFIITITFTAMYVSVTTFHYEMIPEDLLLTLTESRARVPFPPHLRGASAGSDNRAAEGGGGQTPYQDRANDRHRRRYRHRASRRSSGADEQHFDYRRCFFGDCLLRHPELRHERFHSAHSVWLDSHGRFTRKFRLNARSRDDYYSFIGADEP